MIRVLICDDQTIISEGLQLLLETDPDIRVVGMAFDGAEAVSMLPETMPDIVLMDLNMPLMNGVQATYRMRQQFPHIPVLVLTALESDQWLMDAIRAGAAGYLLKGTPRAALVAAVKETVRGKTFVDPDVAGKLLRQFARSAPPMNSMGIALTDREREVLNLIAQGASNADIAGRLYLSEGTVRNYVSSIFDKLDVTDRTQAAVLALRVGLAELR